MRYRNLSLVTLLACSAIVWSCQSSTAETKTADEPTAKTEMTQEEMVKHGQYIVNVGGCNDCHSPKKMGPQGPEIDPSLLLSGHPAAAPLPSIHAASLKPGDWILMGPDLTAFVGPWGISYAANLTSDSATGLGAWTEAQFIKTIRTGKHMGLEGGRPILPPMPWQSIAKFTDEDLKSMFAYLHSLPAVNNRVPEPVSPDKVTAK